MAMWSAEDRDDDAAETPALGEPSASLSELSARFVSAVSVTGASISVITENRSQSTVSASDALAAELDNIQFSLGEGPHWDARQAGIAVIVPDTRGEEMHRWPLFRGAIAKLPVRALFAFPLRLGAVTVGVADLYRVRRGGLAEREVESALMLCRAVVTPAMKHAIRLAEENETNRRGLAAETRRDVHQATGMILAQLDVTATEAFLRLQAHAYGSGATIQQIASDVVGRRIDFRDLPE